MILNPTKYPNNPRTISGLANFAYKDDTFLRCDTSAGPVSIMLLDLPAGKLSTVYKLYIIDATGNAGTNNISISVPAGYKINNTAGPLIINNNGGGCIVRILDDTNYIADINYNATIPSQDYDTGWINLLGFGHMAVPPQFRIINRLITLRGVAVIPLSSTVDGLTLIPYVNENSYINAPFNTPYVGGGTGSAGIFTTSGLPGDPTIIIGFNSTGINNPPSGIATLPAVLAGSSVRYPDNAFNKRDICAYRRVKSSDPAHGVVYNVPIDLVLQTNGSLFISLVNNYEDGNWNTVVKTDSRRVFGTNAVAGQFYDILGGINFGNAAAGVTVPVQGVSDATYQHPITVEIDNANTLGGFSVVLDGFTATINKATPLPIIHP